MIEIATIPPSWLRSVQNSSDEAGREQCSKHSPWVTCLLSRRTHAFTHQSMGMLQSSSCGIWSCTLSKHQVQSCPRMTTQSMSEVKLGRQVSKGRASKGVSWHRRSHSTAQERDRGKGLTSREERRTREAEPRPVPGHWWPWPPAPQPQEKKWDEIRAGCRTCCTRGPGGVIIFVLHRSARAHHCFSYLKHGGRTFSYELLSFTQRLSVIWVFHMISVTQSHIFTNDCQTFVSQHKYKHYLNNNNTLSF